MANGQLLRITQPDGLDQVIRLPFLSSVVLELPSLESDETTRWQSELNTLLHTCGCSEAAAALLITMGVMSVGAWFDWDTVKSAPFLSVALGLAGCVLSIAAGKAFGRLRGRRRLANSVRLLRAVLMQRTFDRHVA